MQKKHIFAVPGKSPGRVPVHYLKYQEDWNRQYDMLLPDGISCSSCVHCVKCTTIFDQKETDTACQFYPSRFIPHNNH
jgi:hypothetical protein